MRSLLSPKVPGISIIVKTPSHSAAPKPPKFAQLCVHTTQMYRGANTRGGYFQPVGDGSSLDSLSSSGPILCPVVVLFGSSAGFPSGTELQGPTGVLCSLMYLLLVHLPFLLSHLHSGSVSFLFVLLTSSDTDVSETAAS